jgi:hypothetical protein
MKRLFEILWHGHEHKWEIINTAHMYSGVVAEGLSLGNKYTLQCKVCGNIKYVKDY